MGFTGLYKVFGFACCEQCSTTKILRQMSEDFLFVVGGAELEQGGSDDASRQSKQSAQLGCCLARGSWTRRNVYQGRTNPVLYEKGFGYVFCLPEVLRCVYARTQENGKIPLYRGVLSWGECGILGLVQQIGSYMWRRIIMNTVRMILCGNVEDSRMNPSEKVGVVSVVFVSTEEEKIKNKLKKLQDKNPEKFYMEYVTPLDVDLTSLEHYPSIEISKNDLQ